MEITKKDSISKNVGKNYCTHHNLSGHFVDKWCKLHRQLHPKHYNEVVKAPTKKEVVEEIVGQAPRGSPWRSSLIWGKSHQKGTTWRRESKNDLMPWTNGVMRKWRLVDKHGVPIWNNIYFLIVVERGSVLFENYHLINDFVPFSREWSPKRVVHVRGASEKCFFEVTHVSNLTSAYFFREHGIQTTMIIWFSTVIHECGSPKILRYPSGFTVNYIGSMTRESLLATTTWMAMAFKHLSCWVSMEIYIMWKGPWSVVWRKKMQSVQNKRGWSHLFFGKTSMWFLTTTHDCASW